MRSEDGFPSIADGEHPLIWDAALCRLSYGRNDTEPLGRTSVSRGTDVGRGTHD
jgi:hypothetical protein